MLNHILWMHDLSERADACLEPVIALGRLGMRVTVAHALGVSMDARPKEQGHSLSSVKAEQVRTERANQHLQPWVDQLRAAGVETDLVVRPGKAPDLLEKLAGAEYIDLVVIGQTGVRGLIDRLLVGSTAVRIAREAPVSAMVVCGQPFSELRRVLCPIEPGNVHGAGVRAAVALSRRAGAQLTFCAVELAGSGSEDLDSKRKKLMDAVAEVTALDDSWQFQAVIAETAVAGITAASEEHDLVVMATAGRSGLERVVLGSVTESVMARCRVPVLVAR